MASAAQSPGEAGVSIGGILSQSFGVMAANPVAIFGIAFLFGALPSQVFGYFFRSVMVGGSVTADAFRTGAINPATVWVAGIVGYIVFLMFSALAQGGIIRAMVAHANGTQASIGDCIGVAMSKALPLIGLSILFALGVWAGMILLFVPGVILFLMWCVAVPALVAEPIGIIGAFGRSRYLTKGARWRILGMMALVLVTIWLVLLIVGVAFAALGIQQASIQVTTNGGTIASMAVGVLLNTFTTAFMSTVLTGLYIALRNWKDGPQVEALADIFA